MADNQDKIAQIPTNPPNTSNNTKPEATSGNRVDDKNAISEDQKKNKRNNNSAKKKKRKQKERIEKAAGEFVFGQKRALQSPGEAENSAINKKPKEDVESEDENMDCEKKSSLRDTLLLERMAVIPEDYPNVCFKLENVKSMEDQILKQIDSLKDDQEAPTFQYRRLERGYWKVACIGESTRAWLMEVMRDWKFLDKPIRVIPLNEIPKPPVYRSWISGSVIPPDNILDRLMKQNKGLDTTEWKHKRSISTPAGFKVYLELNPASINYISERNFMLFFGMTQIKLTLIQQAGDSAGDAEIEMADVSDSGSNAAVA